MGQKIHPLGLRVGITKKHKAKWFANSDQYPKFILEDILLRKLLTSLIPPESLPRVFEDDKKMKIIEIQIERFINNTIKIQIYAVNPDLTSLMLDKKINRDYSSEENNTNLNKKNRKVDKNSKHILSNEKEISHKLNKFKNIIRKKIFELKYFQFKNIIKTCNVLLEIDVISNKTLHDKKIENRPFNLSNIFFQLKQLCEKRYRIQLYLQRIFNKKSILQLPNELERLKLNLFYMYYNLQIYKINFEIFELQHDILQINYKILKKFGILSKKVFINKNVRSIKRILKKFEKKLENLEQHQKIINSPLQLIKYPEILLKNYLQSSLNQQHNKYIGNKYKHRFENEYMNRFGSKLKQKKPIDLMKDLEKYINWHSKKWLEISESIVENQTKYAYFFSFRQLGQKLYLQRKKNYHQTDNFKNNQIKQKNIKIKKLIKRKIQNFMIDDFFRKNFSNNSHYSKIFSNYQVHDFVEFIQKVTLKSAFPKISGIEIIEVKQPSEYAICLAYFIIQKLEKRFSFRSVMKQAKRLAIQTPSVKGIKIQLSGRLNGAEIARTEWIREGRVPLQTLEADVDYSYKTAQTLYGIIGVKVWIFRKKSQY